MRLAPTTIRMRLTLWYASILGLIVVCFASATYVLVRRSLFSQADRRLERNLRTLVQAAQDELEEVEELAEYGTLSHFEVLLGDRLLYRTPGWPSEVIDIHPAAPPESSESRFMSADGRWLVGLRSAGPADRPYRIAAAVDIEPIRSSLRALARILSSGIPGALLLAGFAGHMLARRVLSPIGTMAATAERITATNLSERIPVVNPDDELGRLARVFNETLARLEGSFEHLRRFTGDVSHELRTPLAVVRSIGEVAVARDLDPEACREVIGSILEETDHLTRLVDRLLILSRADIGQVKIRRESVELAPIVRETIDSLRVLAEEKEQEISFRTDGHVAAEIDPVTFRQALLNLIDNAIRYTPEGGRIRIEIRETTPGTVSVEIADNGPGIPPEHRSKIFDRFYRVGDDRSRRTGGAGLGLAIARWAVEANGGRIEVDSADPQGAVFRIVLSTDAEGGDA